MEFLADYYLAIKAAHIIFVIFWMAGLFMMPRYLAYHMQYEAGSEEDMRWQEREFRLQRIIMMPAMIFAWTFGLLLAAILGADIGAWFMVKLLFILGLTMFHMLLLRWRRQMAAGERMKSEKFFRMVNEIPAVVIIAVVILAVLKPF